MRNRAGLHRVIPRVILEPLSDLIKTSEWFNVTFVYRYTQTVTRKARCCLVARPVFIVLSVVRCILGKTETYPVLSTTLGVLTFPGSCKKRKRNQFFGVNVEDLTMPTGVRIDGWERHKKVGHYFLLSASSLFFPLPVYLFSMQTYEQMPHSNKIHLPVSVELYVSLGRSTHNPPQGFYHEAGSISQTETAS